MLLLLGLLLLLLLLLRLLLRIGIVISIVVIGAGIGIGKGLASQQSPGPREVSEKEALASRASPTCPPTPRLCPPLCNALRSCPKLGGARRRSEELAPAASATCERSASMALRRRGWSRERPRLQRAHALPARAALVPLRPGSAHFSGAP